MGRAKAETVSKWMKANVKRYHFYVNKNTDEDVIAWLDSLPNRRQYLLNIIKKDMKNANKKTTEDRQTEDDDA